jgi:cell division protein FtsQ
MNPRLKKIGRNILFLLAIPAIIGAFVFANSNMQNERLSDIHIDIANTELSFVTEDDVLNMISSNNVTVNESIVNQIKIEALEKKIKENKWVNNAEIYITANHAINVKVKQKEPVVRINHIDSTDYAYYLDRYANPIELSEQYIAKVPIVTAPGFGYSRKDLVFKNDLVQLATYIQKDSFWNTMISQINIDKHHEIELIPTLGNHIILLGSIKDLDSKMKRLLAFYQNGLVTIDWNRYNEIDLRYAHQIVARNSNVTELVNTILEKEKLEQAKEARQKYLLAIQKNKNKIVQKETSNKKIIKP